MNKCSSNNNLNNNTYINNNNGNFNNINTNNRNTFLNNGNFTNNNLNNNTNYNNNGNFNNNNLNNNTKPNTNNGNFNRLLNNNINNNNFNNNTICNFNNGNFNNVNNCFNNNTNINYNNGNFNNNNLNNNNNFFNQLNNNTMATYNNDNINNNKNNFNPKTTITRHPKKNDDIEINFLIRAKGLQNVGATCYMNATLQCFYHVKPLTENLINDNNIKSSMEITYCYKNLIEELAGCKNKHKFRIKVQNLILDDKEKDYFEPNDFKNLIGKLNPLFKGIKACDSKDLILFLLENMDRELTERNNKTSNREIFYGKGLSQMEEENFKKIHNSIFSELFYGFQKSRMECLNCNHVDDTFTIINFLIFPLEKVYLTKNKNDNNNYIMNNKKSIYYRNISNNFNNNGQGYINQFNCPTSINLTNKFTLKTYYGKNNRINNYIKKKLDLLDCFDVNESEELLSGLNQIYCNNCHQNSNAKTKNEIYKAPNVLILILNRGKGNIFECDLDFPMQLDISKYAKCQNSPKIYDLIGIISHFGESSMEGHFIAYCKHFDDNWYMFNDAIVKSVDNKDIYKGTPYILFYQNKDIN